MDFARRAQSEHPWMPVLRWARQEQEMIDRNVRDYSATIVSRERIGDKLEEYQSIFVKVRHRPPSVYVYVLTPEGHKGDEAIYVEGRNDGKLLGHTTGITGRMVGTVALDPQGSTAMNGQRHPITELGIRHLCQRLIGLGSNDVQFAESQVRFLSGLKLNDRRCSGLEVIHPVPRTSFQFHRLRLFVDEQLKLPVRYEQYDWPQQPGGPPELVEEYNFMNVQINNGFTDADFDPATPATVFPSPASSKWDGAWSEPLGEMVGYARSRTLNNVSRCFGPVRATHHRAGTSVLHPPKTNNPG